MGTVCVEKEMRMQRSRNEEEWLINQSGREEREDGDFCYWDGRRNG